METSTVFPSEAFGDILEFLDDRKGKYYSIFVTPGRTVRSTLCFV